MPTKTAKLLGKLLDHNQYPVVITGDISDIN
jgi:hypothetical protein